MNQKIIPKHSTIIVGLSGGPDSVYLLLQLKKLQSSHSLNIIAAHLNHEWRKESVQDVEWCKSFCKKYNITFVTKKASGITNPKKYNGSKEQQARESRRIFFETIAQQHDNTFIALAHHQDDQIETFFIRLARGTSVQGLTGIKEKDDMYLRPLLDIKKSEILEYLHQHNIPFLEDPTNQDPSFLRNRIRNILIPTLVNVDERFPQNIVAAMKQLQATDSFLHQVTEQAIDQLSIDNNNEKLQLREFLQLNPVLQQRILLKLLIQAQAQFTPTASLFAEIIRFLRSTKHQEHHVHPTYKIVKNKNSFSIIQQ